MVHTYNRKDGSKKLSNHFRLREFACNCGCSTVLVDDVLLGYLQQIRDHFGKAVCVTSAYRCARHNAAVGGASGSFHVKGQAADIYIPGIAPVEIAKFAESIGVKRIGLYEKADCGDDFVHIDTGTVKAFWYGHKQAHRDTFGGRQTFTLEVPVLRQGDSGEAVRALQAQLKGYGYSLTVDGQYGPKTANAVTCYQEDNDLTPDGIAGPVTRKAMLGLE